MRNRIALFSCVLLLPAIALGASAISSPFDLWAEASQVLLLNPTATPGEFTVLDTWKGQLNRHVRLDVQEDSWGDRIASDSWYIAYMSGEVVLHIDTTDHSAEFSVLLFAQAAFWLAALVLLSLILRFIPADPRGRAYLGASVGIIVGMLLIVALGSYFSLVPPSGYGAMGLQPAVVAVLSLCGFIIGEIRGRRSTPSQPGGRSLLVSFIIGWVSAIVIGLFFSPMVGVLTSMFLLLIADAWRRMMKRGQPSFGLSDLSVILSLVTLCICGGLGLLLFR